MAATNHTPIDVQRSLERLADTGDRSAPVVFAGRRDELALLERANRSVRNGEEGHTVVVQGVPGAGKTALLGEFAAQLLARGADGRGPVIPVKLAATALDSKPAAIVEEIDSAFGNLKTSEWWRRAAGKATDGAHFLGNALLAAVTRKSLSEFTVASRAPDSLNLVLNDYASLRFGWQGSTILLLVDEAQNLPDTPMVRRHLETLHTSGTGASSVMLACFGLGNTVERLAELGLSRLATGHVRTVGPLSDEDARKVVAGTLDVVFAQHPFGEHEREKAPAAGEREGLAPRMEQPAAGEREGLAPRMKRDRKGRTPRMKWIGAATDAIVAESGGFPHHLTNGCRALAQAVLQDGIGANPPLDAMRAKALGYRREYYGARLRPWARYETALACAFTEADHGRMPADAVVAALTTVAKRGSVVGEDTAWQVVEEICAAGFMVECGDFLELTLPSLMTHFRDVFRRVPPNVRTMEAVRAALSGQ